MADTLSLSKISQPSATVVPSRRVAAVEVTVAVALVLLLVWTDHRTVLDRSSRTGLHLVVAAMLIGLFVRRLPTVQTLGLHPKSWTAGVPVLAAVTAAALAAMFAFAPANLKHGDPSFNLARWLARNWHIDVIQQMLLQWFLAARLQTCIRSSRELTSLTAAMIFGCLHMPNLPLVAATTIAGYFWCEWFHRYRNFPAVALSHITLAAATIGLLGMSDLRVGIGYVQRSSTATIGSAVVP